MELTLDFIALHVSHALATRFRRKAVLPLGEDSAILGHENPAALALSFWNP